MNYYKKHKLENSFIKNKYTENFHFKSFRDHCECNGSDYDKNDSELSYNNDDFMKEKYCVENKTYSNKQQQYCNNCGKYGHLFSSCVVPITSLGIIAFRKKMKTTYSVDVPSDSSQLHIDTEERVIEISSESKDINNQFEYLMIQRVDSFGYVEFMRGKYSLHNYSLLKNIIDEMTIQEKQNILTKPFDDLWISLWGEYSGLQYKGEQQTSKNKYLQLKSGIKRDGMTYSLDSLISSSTTQWETAEWGFPKGRRNNQEKDLDCAIREFTEETGYSKESLQQVYNIFPYEEIFFGSNMKCYKNKYFLHYMNNSNMKLSSGYQKSEVNNMKWLSYNECMNIIRPYNVEKKNMLTSINNTLHKFYICNV
jgi:ADP-ribose pyrophosphatase YjhB (NUDIX family)